jgi:uncharacterized protein YceK
MIRRSWTIAFVAFVVVAPVGCGTVKNFRDSGKREPFGGVRDNLENIEYNADRSHIRMCPRWTIAVCAVDLPFSFVGDIITLPWTRRDVGAPNTQN